MFCIFDGDLGPIPADQFVQARILLADKHNYMRMTQPNERVVRAIMSNAPHLINSPTNPHKGVNVTATRVKRYSDGLDGVLDDRKPVTDAQLLYMSLYKVNVRPGDHDDLQNRPTWTSTEVCTAPCVKFIC